MSNRLQGGTGINIISTSDGIEGTYNTGVVRWNGSTRVLEVMGPGNCWDVLSFPTHTVSLEREMTELLAWVKKQKEASDEVDALCREHPGLSDDRDRFLAMLELVRRSKAA